MLGICLKCLLMFHPFFVSVADVNHNPKTKSLEVSVRIFTDDFEKTLRKNNPSAKIDLLHPTDKSIMDKIVKTYVSNHLHINVDGKLQTLNYVGYEQIEESIWCYFEISNIPSMKKISLDDTVLYDFQPKQTNMCIVHYGGNEKTREMANPDGKVAFDF